MKSILDPCFRYTPSHETDVRKTFERLRREQQERWQAQARAESAKGQLLALARGAFSTERG